MDTPMIIFILIVMLSRLANISLAFNNVGKVHDYSNTDIPLDSKGFENSIEGTKKPLMQSIPVGNIEEIEKFGNGEIEELENLPSLSRKARCKYPRISWKSRRAKKLSGAAATPYKHASALRSTSADGRTENPLRKQLIRTSSIANARNSPNNFDNSRTTRENEHEIQEIVMLPPRAVDSVVLISEGSKAASNEAPKNYVGQSLDSNDETMQTSKEQILSYTPFKSRQSEQETQEKSVQLNNPKAANLRQDGLFSEILMKQSTIPKRLTQQSSSPCIPGPATSSEPIKIGIPLNLGQEMDNSFHKDYDKWSPEEILQKFSKNRQMRPDIYQSFKIHQNVPSPNLTPYTAQKCIPYPSYAEEPMYQDPLVSHAMIPNNENLEQPFVDEEGSIPDGFEVIKAPTTVKEMEDCIKDFGLEHCIPIPVKVRSYVPNSPGYDASHYDPKIDLQQPKKFGTAAADPLKRELNQSNYPASNYQPEKHTSSYASPGAAGVNGVTLNHTAEKYERKAHNQHSIGLFQLINAESLRERLDSDLDFRSPTTTKYVFVDTKLHQIGAKLDEYDYIGASTPQNNPGQNVDHTSISGDTGETNDYHDASNDSDKNDIPTLVTEAIATDYPEWGTEVSQTYRPAHNSPSNRRNSMTQSTGSNENNSFMADVTKKNHQSYQVDDFDEAAHQRKSTNLEKHTTIPYDYAGKQNQYLNIDIPSEDSIRTSEDALKQTPTISIPGTIGDKDWTSMATAVRDRKFDELSESPRDISRAIHSKDYGLVNRDPPFVDYHDYSKETTPSNVHLTTNVTKNIFPGKAASSRWQEDELTTNSRSFVDQIAEISRQTKNTPGDQDQLPSTLESLLDQTDETFDQNKNPLTNQYDDELILKDGDVSETLVRRIGNDFKTAAPLKLSKKESTTNLPRITDEIALAQRLLLVPEVQYLALHNAKPFISDMSDLSTFESSMAHVADKTQQTLSDENLKEYIANLLHYSGVTGEQVKSKAIENILFNTIQQTLKNAELEVNNANIWDNLRTVLSQSRFPRMNHIATSSIKERVSTIQRTDMSDETFKRLPFIPVREHVFKDGQWIEKSTLLGSSRKQPEPKSTQTLTESNKSDSHFTTGQIDHALHANSVKISTEKLNTDNHTPENDAGIINHMTDPTAEESLPNGHEVETNEGENEKLPIKYYSPTDRILAYRKKIQAPKALGEKTTVSPEPSILGDSLIPITPTPQKFPLTTKNASKFSKPMSKSTATPSSNINSLSNEKSREKPDSSSNPEFETHSEKDNGSILGIVNSDNVGKYISAPGHEEYSTTSRNTSRLTMSPEEDSTEKSEQLETTESSLDATKSSKQGRQYQQISNDQMVNPQDQILNYEQSSSIERFSSTTAEYDPTYFGKITLDSAQSLRRGMSDLTDTDLFYIGDGVKIPLRLSKMADGSLGLSISEKILENFANGKCSRCVPNERDTVEEKRHLKKDYNENGRRKSKKKKHSLLDEIGSLVSNVEAKERRTRSFLKTDLATTSISPVTEFVERYNVRLHPENIESLINNVSEKNAPQMDHDDPINKSSKSSNFTVVQELTSDKGSNEIPKNLFTINDVSEAENGRLNDPLKGSEKSKSAQTKFSKITDVSENKNDISQNPIDYSTDSNYSQEHDSMMEYKDIFAPKTLNIYDVTEDANDEAIGNSAINSMDSQSVQNLSHPISYQNVTQPKLSTKNNSSEIENVDVSRNPMDGSIISENVELSSTKEHQDSNKQKFSGIKIVSEAENAKVAGNLEHLPMDHRDISKPKFPKINNASQTQNDKLMGRWSWVHDLVNSTVNNSAQKHNAMVNSQDIDKAIILKIDNIFKAENAEVVGSPVGGAMNSDSIRNIAITRNYRVTIEPEPLETNSASQIRKASIRKNSIDDLMNSEAALKVHTRMGNSKNGSMSSDSADIPNPVKNFERYSANVIRSLIDGPENAYPVKNLNPIMNNQNIVEPRVQKIKNVRETANSELVINSVDSLDHSKPVQNGSPGADHQDVDEPEPKISDENQKRLNGYHDYDFTIMTNEKAEHDYQEDNPILNRMQSINKERKYARPYRYQQHMDDEVQERMDVMTTVLHWFKDIFFEPTALSDD